MESPVSKQQTGMKSSQTYRILPAVAEEVKALALLDHEATDHPSSDSSRAGSLKTNITDLPYVLVILGTKVSEGHPSAVGFRILLRRVQQGRRPTSEADANYITLSFKYESGGNNLTLRRASVTDKECWRHAKGDFFSKIAHSENEFPEAQENLYCLDMTFTTPEEDHFECYYRKELSSLSQIDQIDKTVACVQRSNRVRIFFSSDAVLLDHLRIAIAHDCRGTEVPSWNKQLHKDLLSAWPSGPQNRMVAGSSDLLNVIRQTLREQKLVDGRDTKPDRRPDARLFRDFIRKTYPSARQEPEGCVYPVFFHVIGGCCVELPFGGYLVNRENVNATISILHELLNVPFQTTDVGIVTLYSAQVEIYRQALQVCHTRAPRKGYSNVWVATIEDWAHKETSFAIVDLVRTATSNGNLGFLSQVRRLEAAFSLHRDGLVVVGDINCSVSADGSVTSSKLDKALNWFRDHGRVVQVGNGTQPGPIDSGGKTGEPYQNVSGAQASLLAMMPPNIRYVGIPELETRHGHNYFKVKSRSIDSTTTAGLEREITGPKERSAGAVLQPTDQYERTSAPGPESRAVMISLPGRPSEKTRSQDAGKPSDVAMQVEGNRFSLSDALNGQQQAAASEPRITPFQIRYHARYRAIRALFDSVDHQQDNEKQTSLAPPHTNDNSDMRPQVDVQLLRQLTEAYKSEKGDTFTSLYIQMLLQAENLRT